MTAMLNPFRPTGHHRAADEVRRLTALARDLQSELVRVAADRRAADDTIDDLRTRAIGAETVAACLDRQVDEVTAENEQLTAENQALRARLANAEALTVRPAVRDTAAIEDQATAPIQVTTLRHHFAA